jgi:hypothetical protein
VTVGVPLGERGIGRHGHAVSPMIASRGGSQARFRLADLSGAVSQTVRFWLHVARETHIGDPGFRNRTNAMKYPSKVVLTPFHQMVETLPFHPYWRTFGWNARVSTIE